MDDIKIIDLFWERSETAIAETSKKYSGYCHTISYNILHNNQDAEECVNDTYLRAWNAIPPKRPNQLSTYLGKITRNLSLNKFKQYNTQKRGLGQTELVLSELEDCIPSVNNVEIAMNEIILTEAVNRFLAMLPKASRVIFVRRYWYLSSIGEIAKQYDLSESKVKSRLFRARNKLKAYLEKEGITL